jgi:hypothetical protein
MDRYNIYQDMFKVFEGSHVKYVKLNSSKENLHYLTLYPTTEVLHIKFNKNLSNQSKNLI